MSSPVPSTRIPPPTTRPPQQHIETIVIDDSDSEPELVPVQSSRPRNRSGNANKTFHLPGPGQPGEHPTPTQRSAWHAAGKSGPVELSDRAKAKSRALDPPLLSAVTASSTKEKAMPPPYQADPDAEPIQHALLSTYNCPICLCPPVSAAITPCGHLFCGNCLFDALLTQTKKKQAEEAERRIFNMTNSPSFVLPRFLPPSVRLTPDLNALDGPRATMYQAMVNAATAMAEMTSQLDPRRVANPVTMRNPDPSGSMGSNAGQGSSNTSRRHANSHHDIAPGAPRTSTAASSAASAALPAVPARPQSSAPSSPSASASSSLSSTGPSHAPSQTAAEPMQAAQIPSGSQASLLDGARAAAQNAYDRLPSLAAMFNYSTAHTSTAASPPHWAVDNLRDLAASSRGLARSASPAASSLASSSSTNSGSGTSGLSAGPSRLSRPHPGMTAQQGWEYLRSSSPGARARLVHNLAGICPLCRGEIPKGFNVNMRTLPERSKYFHKAGNPRRSVKNISHCKGKVMGLRLTLGRPVDDPYSVNIERRKKRSFAEMEDGSETPVIVQDSSTPVA
ncbi:hypothetical protein OC846_004386 [Tilletia horrida]|uniref:RING-type domain-containing protein n=1 Tax=Tilletia horrida TaxID=155126 RepID=A0AAN6GNE0_9BASI|nr:hypothetical protein OC845_003929 [Tilletia horrida]KAK0548698.1 hypothetical protein OC846_004386 [Tilletia horrida]KAK0566937.1 hypothetical protein OC861_002980 [Tilletia horrida]